MSASPAFDHDDRPIPAAPEHAPASSGPRTEDGRRRSRQNARTHGLTATLPDGEAEAKLMQDFADQWVNQIGADHDIEAALIRSSAVAYARLERCRKVEENTLRESSRKALETWERKKRHAVRRKAQNLSQDPTNTIADLEASSFGCEWIIRHWQRLDAKLEQGIAWDRDDFPLAMRLLGFFPQQPGPDAPIGLRRFWHLIRLVSGFPSDPLPGQPTELIPARLDLRRIIAEELDRLQDLREQHWHDHDGPEADSVAQLALIDTSKEGQLRQRYRREAFSEMVRGINQVMRLRVERSKDQDRQWHQAHPHVSRKRFADTPSTGAGLPNVASRPADPPGDADPARPEPPRSVDSRNEPSATAPTAAGDRLNPNSNNELRRAPSRDLPAADPRTEAQFPGVPTAFEGPMPRPSDRSNAPDYPDSP